MVNAGQTPDKETLGIGERLSRRPGIDQEDGFLRLSTGLFGIYQPDGNGKYDFVYLGKISEVGSLSLSNFKKLLQNGRVADFTGRPLSTKDIIVLTGSGKPRVQAFRINGNKLEPCQQFVKEREAGLPPLISNKEKLPAVKRTRPVKPCSGR